MGEYRGKHTGQKPVTYSASQRVRWYVDLAPCAFTEITGLQAHKGLSNVLGLSDSNSYLIRWIWDGAEPSEPQVLEVSSCKTTRCKLQFKSVIKCSSILGIFIEIQSATAEDRFAAGCGSPSCGNKKNQLQLSLVHFDSGSQSYEEVKFQVPSLEKCLGEMGVLLVGLRIS